MLRQLPQCLHQWQWGKLKNKYLYIHKNIISTNILLTVNWFISNVLAIIHVYKAKYICDLLCNGKKSIYHVC